MLQSRSTEFHVWQALNANTVSAVAHQGSHSTDGAILLSLVRDQPPQCGLVTLDVLQLGDIHQVEWLHCAQELKCINAQAHSIVGPSDTYPDDSAHLGRHYCQQPSHCHATS
eukprot:2523272-Amphidinium_carterae.2